MAVLAALIVLGVILVTGGDDTSSTGSRPAGDPLTDEAAPQAPPAEEPARRKEPAAPSEPQKGSGRPKDNQPPKGSGQPKKEKPSKTPAGKAKGRSKH
jgi:hypothetical protein